MTPERFQQVDQLISLVLEQEPSGRRAFLDKACSGDRELREEVESLLAADEGAGNFLSKPAAPLVAGLRDDDSKLKLGPKQGDAAAAPPVSAVGRYVVLGELGGGGMGLVYAAYDPELDRKVAIKLMRPEASAAISPSKGRERLLREAQAMAQLMHPNVIAIHDVGTFGDQVFIAMEYGEGSTLTDWLAAEKRTWPEIVSLFVQAGRGLAAAHAKGILHRDFKPDNVWVGEDGRARVLDFGLARATRTSNGEDLQLPGAQPSDEKKLSPRVAMLGVPVTEPGKFLGTPAYMAPEQLVGELGDARADQFSFCVALYQGLYGELPYVGETVAALLDEMKHHSIREAPKSSRVPSWLRRVLLRGLSPNRADRYESMDRLLDELARRPFLTRRRSLTLGILAVLVLLVVAGSVAWQRRNAASGRIHSIAVLPLENLTGDSSQEYFVDGVTEALITNLAQLSSVSVISRGSIMRYKNPRKPVAQIAKELSVDVVVKGSVVRSGTLVRIDAQLLRAATNRQIWARSYQHDLSDIVRLQTEVAGAIVSEIEAKITPQQQARLAKVRSVVPEAYEAYLKARHVLAKRSEPAVRQGIAYLEHALREDPGYAPAYAALAEAYNFLASPNAVLPPKEASRLATAAAMKAISLDETLAEAHSILGLVKGQLDWDWPSAERELKRAIELNPNDAYAHNRYGGHLLRMKRMDESLVELKLAARLDPVGISGPKIVLANWFIAAKQYDAAIAKFQKIIELDPDYAPAHALLSSLYDQLGMYQEAFAEIQKASELSGSRWIQAALAHALVHLGRTVEANKIIGEIEAEAKHTNAAFTVATTYAVLGRREEALQWLEHAYEARAQGMLSLSKDSELDSLRADPRFQELVHRVGLLK